MKAKKKIRISEELRIQIRDLIKSITKFLDDYDKEHMKINFDSNKNLLLNKTIEIPIKTIVIRAIFHEKKNKYYPQVFFR